MEKSLKVMFSAIIGLVLFNSCSKENEDPQPENEQKKIAVELSYTGIEQSSSAGLSIKIFGEDVSTTEVKGIDWNEVVVDDNKNGAQFLGEVEALSEPVKTVRLETSKPVWGCTTISTFGPDLADQETPVVVSVKYYIEDELVKTDDFTPTAENFYSYNEQLMVSDY